MQHGNDKKRKNIHYKKLKIRRGELKRRDMNNLNEMMRRVDRRKILGENVVVEDWK